LTTRSRFGPWPIRESHDVQIGGDNKCGGGVGSVLLPCTYPSPPFERVTHAGYDVPCNLLAPGSPRAGWHIEDGMGTLPFIRR